GEPAESEDRAAAAEHGEHGPVGPRGVRGGSVPLRVRHTADKALEARIVRTARDRLPCRRDIESIAAILQEELATSDDAWGVLRRRGSAAEERGAEREQEGKRGAAHGCSGGGGSAPGGGSSGGGAGAQGEPGERARSL